MKKILAILFLLIAVKTEAATWPDYAGLHLDYVKTYSSAITDWSLGNRPAGDFMGGPGNPYYYNYFLFAMAYAVQASGSTTEMQQLVTIANNMIAYGSSPTGNCAITGHKVWGPCDPLTGRPIQQLGQFKGASALAKLAAVIRGNTAFKAYDSTATAIVNFLDDSVHQLWMVDIYNGLLPNIDTDLGGSGCYVYPGYGPACTLNDKEVMLGTMYVHLWEATRANPAGTNSATYLLYARRVATAMRRHFYLQSTSPYGNQGTAQTGWLMMDPCIGPNPALPYATGTPQRCYPEDPTHLSIPDTSHFNPYVGAAVAFHEAGLTDVLTGQTVFSNSDMQALAKTFSAVIWNGSTSDPRFSNYMNGSNAVYSNLAAWENGSVLNGPALLARYSPTAMTAFSYLLKAMIDGPANPTVSANSSDFGWVGVSGTLAWANGAIITPAPPTITITQPVSGTTGTNSVNLQGTATGTSLTTIAWTNDRGGSDSIAAASNWTISSIPLKTGINNLSVVVTDAIGQQGTASKTITYIPTFPGNALVGAWGLEAGSGTSAIDSSGTVPANNGTLFNAPTWTTSGKFGKAIIFNGTTQYINVADANSLDFTQSFTFSAWVQPTAVHNDWRPIIIKNATGLGWPVQFLYASGAAGVLAGCNAGAVVGGFVANGSSASLNYVCYNTPLPIGSPSHVAVRYDNTTALLKLFLNGSEVASTTASGYMEETTQSLMIGADNFSEYFDGMIDEPRAYNFAIPATAGANATPYAVCGYTNYTATVRASPNYDLASIVGDMNCAVMPLTPPVTLQFPASATGLEIGVGGAEVEFGAVP